MRFTIRDLMWLMVVVAFYLGWWIQQRDARRQRLDNQTKIAAQAAELKGKDAQIAMLQDNLSDVRAAERAVREQLVEFVATQEDKARVDVAPVWFHRVTAPR